MLSRFLSLTIGLAVLSITAVASTVDHVTTTREMCAAYGGAPSENWSFALTGTVTWCHKNNFVLKDQTGNCNLFNVLDDSLTRGELIAVTGIVHITQSQQPWIDYIHTTRLGTVALPAPRKTTIKDSLAPELTLEGVAIEATVIDIRSDEFDAHYDWLILKDKGYLMSAVCEHKADNHALIGARVEVTGPVCHYVLGVRKFITPFINLDLGGTVRVLTPPPDDPFDVPLINLTGYASQSDIECLGKHAAVGRIVAVWPPNNCLLQTPERRYVHLALAIGEPLPASGSHVRAVGYPSSDSFTIWLTRAKTIPEEQTEIPDETPKAMSAKDILPETSDLNKPLPVNRLVTIAGTLRSLKVHSDGTRRATLDSNGIAIPVDFTVRPRDFDGIAVGSEISLTGRCIIANERWNPNNVIPEVTEILLVLTEKPSVLRGPGWWTTPRLLCVIAALIVALVAMLLRGSFVRRVAKLKLGERTRLAVEIHDSLSQSLTGLACHISAARNTITTDMPTACAKLDTANQMLLSCRTELRNCLFDLRNDTLGEKDFRTAIVKTLEPFEDNAAVIVRFNVPRARFEDSTVHAILAIIRELVSNSIRHGHAWTIRIAGIIDRDTLRFSVTDDGSGFDFEHRRNSDDGHFGLDGVRERLVRLGGSIAFSKPPHGGVKATVIIPIPRKST